MTYRRSPIVYLFYAPVAAALLLWGLWFVVIPDSMVSDLIEKSFKDSNMSVQITNLKKGVFFDLSMERIALQKSGNTLFSIDNASGRINLLSLFMARLSLNFSGDTGGGKISGRIDLFKGGNHIAVKTRDVHLEELPFFGLTGLDGRGVVSGELNLENGKGNTTLNVREAAFKSGTFGGVTFPLEMFNSMRGAFSIDDSVLKVVSFSLEGKGIYARIKGVITGGTMNLTAQVMPDKTFMDNNPLFLMLNNYKVAPGVYSIPINGNLPF